MSAGSTESSVTSCRPDLLRIPGCLGLEGLELTVKGFRVQGVFRMYLLEEFFGLDGFCVSCEGLGMRAVGAGRFRVVPISTFRLCRSPRATEDCELLVGPELRFRA